MGLSIEPLVIRHRRRVPTLPAPAGRGGEVARQFDVALMSVGFKLSTDLLDHLSGQSPVTVTATAAQTLAAVREMVGDHVRHNVYFVDFPKHVPDTAEFWLECVRKALADNGSRPGVLAQLRGGVVNLLSLPTYGRYQHTYAEMLQAHEELLAGAGDRITLLHRGGPLEEEGHEVYLALAGSTTPLNDGDLEDLEILAEHFVAGPHPPAIPIRENRAVVNRVRVLCGERPLLDTATDVLRLACALSEGDVSLLEPTRFAPMPRWVRRALLAGLDAVVAADPAKLADVHAHREQWKRLGERLHPHEYPRWPHAADAFAVARGEKRARSFDSRVQALLTEGDVIGAVRLLENAPGKLLRALDHLLRSAATPEEREAVVAAVEKNAGGASGRVVLSAREHLHNRRRRPGDDNARSRHRPPGRRMFVNGRGRAWITRDLRPPLREEDRGRLVAALDAEVRRRLPDLGPLLVDPDILDVALPLSGKAALSGLGVLPRGSRSPVDGDLLRFFVYWRQTGLRTDFDLSAQMLDAKFQAVAQLSYTSLTEVEGEHSGDITEAPKGASEFINLRMGAVRGRYIVPQVNIFAGEGFEDVAESFFGFMLRDREQKGRPFEPRTVRMKSELRGPGRVALPLVFVRDGDRWHARWLHLYLRGLPWGNRVEENRATISTLVSAVVKRDHLTVRYLVRLLEDEGAAVTVWDGGTAPDGPVTYLGLERPEGLHPDSRIITPENLRDLIPA